MTTSFSYTETLIEICTDGGVDPPKDKILALNELRQAARLRAFLDVPEGVLTMLESLHDEHFTIVVVSNCSVEEAAHFEASPLSRRVDDVVWSFREGVQKPDPELFLRACARARADPTATAFVGDGSFDELRGAAAVGLTPVWASWFTHGWPAPLAVQRRAEVDRLGIREARTPGEVLRVVLADGTH
jgi:HAD superfamily hydrolase (TIGR01509 family)